ncbi:uncharacterized protein BP5553_03427 [Venustampulla echinocandica]|uniref:Uncharacterized protein n=1 Tax=Venustampulla echinocandica TaxID=2656787 RepID=A0A370TU78_9HELO|nr:uncharacterized protein BP5553_03427 [Venustampulla echinocandica]RDL39087.1 hypothetical protein BP5553_03427 [Venustampulla echinocandica]
MVYKLVRSLMPHPLIWENICEDVAGHEYHLDRVGTVKTLAAHFTSFIAALQLPASLELPLEITSCICEYLGELTPYSAFVIIAGEASRLVTNLHSPSSREIVLERGYYLAAKTITIFEREYIQDLVCSEYSEENCQAIGIIQEVKFVTSLGGICAVKLIGSEWETDWIGKFPSTGCTWHGSIRGSVRVLRFNYNDLHCASNILSSEPYLTCQIMWDQYNFPSSFVDPESALLVCRGNPRNPSRFAKTLRRRFFRYLDLFHGDEYISGLTIYTSSSSMVGLEAHFRQTTRLLGFRVGCPQYFPMQENERVAYIWLHIDDDYSLAYNQPALDIQTTFGRTYSFGRYIHQVEILQGEWKWILLKNKGCVSGIYYENSRWPKSTKNLGITGDGSPEGPSPQPLQYHASPSYSQIAAPNHLFLSVATLNHLRRVDLCRVANRYTGMLIQYVSGTTAVLGQWHNPGVSQHSCIHDSDLLGICSVYFRMSISGKNRIVTDIGFLMNSDEAISDSDIHIFNVETHLAWWFSEFYDEIVPWTGVLLDIP